MYFYKSGNIVAAKGDGWRYEQVGDLKQFTQTKKLPSLRIIKTLIKRINNI